MSNNTLQFDLTARREKNLRVLKTVDENIIEILEDYAHVAVYQFEVDSRRWERLDVEGTLFITRSLSDPFYSLIVLNKKGERRFLCSPKRSKYNNHLSRTPPHRSQRFRLRYPQRVKDKFAAAVFDAALLNGRCTHHFRNLVTQ